MGCDIHAFVEYRQSFPARTGGWYSASYDGIDLDRDYRAFGFMAGVRGTGEPVAEPRGLPSDRSWSVSEHLSGDADIHTPSWLSLAEFKEAIRRSVESTTYPIRPLYPAVVAMMEVLEAAGHETRIVFGFDN